MSCIKTGEWIKKLMQKKGCQCRDIEEELHFDRGTLEPILDGLTLGSIAVWDALLQRYEPASESVDSERVIDELMEELESHEETDPCVVYYKKSKDTIIFVDYLMEEDLPFCSDLPKMDEMSQVKMTLSEALTYFQFQNYVKERSAYRLHVTYTDGRVVDETNFTDDEDFEQSIFAFTSMLTKPEPFIRSFQAYINGRCVEDSDQIDYVAIRDDEGNLMGIGKNKKK